MRTELTPWIGAPVATATTVMLARSSSRLVWRESHSGGGRITPSTPVSSRRCTAARWLRMPAHFSTRICAPLRLPSSSTPIINWLR